MLNNSSKKSKQQKSGTLLINYHFVYYNMLWQALKTWAKSACKWCKLIFKSIQESIRTIIDTKSWLKFLQLHFMWLSYITNLWFVLQNTLLAQQFLREINEDLVMFIFSMKHFDGNVYLSILYCEQYYTFFYVA